MSALGKKMTSLTFSRLSLLYRLKACERLSSSLGKLGRSSCCVRTMCTNNSSGGEVVFNDSEIDDDVELDEYEARLLEGPGPFKSFTEVYFWDKSKRVRAQPPTFDYKKVEQLMEEMNFSLDTVDDQPAENLPDPFMEPYKKCLLCNCDAFIDYKNTKLLSQFISSVTGRIYGRQITGLCIPMQRNIARQIKRARDLGFMAYYNKNPDHFNDPNIISGGKRL